MIAAHPSLTCLSVSQCHVTDTTLAALAQHCPQLSSLSLYMCGDVTDEGIITLSEHCPLLKTLNLTSIHGMTDAILNPLLENCPDIDIVKWFPPVLMQGVVREHNHRKARRARENKTIFD
jgi:hypothetical protein